MQAYFLDSVPWQQSQGLYHAAAHLGREALLIVRPATPYVDVGYHQDPQTEIDLEFAQRAGIPVHRREVGGGTVYLDGDQLFYQLVLRRGHPALTGGVAEFYRKFLAPVVDTYREFGVAAEHRPVNDIVAGGRKISGTGAGEIEGMWVLVGNFIVDFDYRMMARLLRVPDETFRQKVFETMSENLTTIRRETGSAPSNAALAEALIRRYEELLGQFEQAEPDAELLEMSDRLMAEQTAPEWLFANDRRRTDMRQVKIAEGLYVVQRTVRAPGGLIRASAVSESGRLRDVQLEGDFTMFPGASVAALERALDGVEQESAAIAERVERFFRERGIEAPGLKPEHITEALRGVG